VESDGALLRHADGLAAHNGVENLYDRCRTDDAEPFYIACGHTDRCRRAPLEGELVRQRPQMFLQRDSRAKANSRNSETASESISS